MFEYIYLDEFKLIHVFIFKSFFRLIPNVVIFEVDDKTTIPVGSPNTPVQATQRQKRALTLADESSSSCDHDICPQHIIPSVSIRVDVNIHEANEKIDWFGGQVFIGLKCAIFQPSTALRHVAELSKKIDRHTTDSEKDHMILLSDGGGDHNVVHVSVILALIILFLLLDLDSILAVRTPPYLSVLNPAERFMGVANLALYNLGLSQDELTEEEGRIISKCVTKSEWRELERKEGLKKPSDRVDIKALAKKSINSALSVLRARFESLEYDDKKVIVEDDIDEDCMSQLIPLLEKIDPEFDFRQKKITKANLMKSRKFKEFFDKHCCSLTYSLHIRKCDDPTCSCHLPIRNKELHEQLAWFPAPEINPNNKEKYLSFDETYGKLLHSKEKPNETCKPSDAKGKTTAQTDLIKPNFPYVNTKARYCVSCHECGKGRLLYSNKLLSGPEKTLLKVTLEQNLFTCGKLLFEEGHELNQVIFQHHMNDCRKAMTAAYYNAGKKCTAFQFICSVCAEPNTQAVETNEFRSLPRCENCQKSGYKIMKGKE